MSRSSWPQTASGPDAEDAYRRLMIVDGSIAPLMNAEYVARLHASGVTAVNWTVCRPWSHMTPAIEEIAAGLEFVASNSDCLVLARSLSDIKLAKETQRVAVILGPQNALPVEGSPSALRILYELGVRILQITYNERNAFGDGAAEESNAGLSIAGRRLVEDMNRLGVVADVSHCGDRTTLDVIEASSQPVLVTHANSRAVHASPRNKTDEAIKALAARGGVIGLTLWSPMVRSDLRPTLTDFMRHVAYVADLVGIDHVGIGTDHSEGVPRASWVQDFGPGGRYPTITGSLGSWYAYDTRFTEGATSVSEFPAILDAIAKLGLTNSELEAVAGGNFLRVLGAVWKGSGGFGEDSDGST